MASSPRDVHARLNYFNQDAPRSDVNNFSGVLEYDKNPRILSNSRQVMVLDGRVHNGGVASWKLDEHGFAFIRAPEPVRDFADPKLVRAEWEPRVLEVVKSHTGASRVFWMGHMRRTEGEGATAQPGGATKIRSDGYGRLAHTDYGPEFEPLFRKMLVERMGLPEAEARSCGLCVVNVWAPIERPAYKDPLCLLDHSSVPAEKREHMIPYMTTGNIGYKRGSGQYSPNLIPQASQDAPSYGPVYSPQHRWVYLPDMRPDEAVIFKQHDYRQNAPNRARARARTGCHSAFSDHFHENWAECPGRRSIECRLLLTFDNDGHVSKL